MTVNITIPRTYGASLLRLVPATNKPQEYAKLLKGERYESEVLNLGAPVVSALGDVLVHIWYRREAHRRVRRTSLHVVMGPEDSCIVRTSRETGHWSDTFHEEIAELFSRDPMARMAWALTKAAQALPPGQASKHRKALLLGRAQELKRTPYKVLQHPTLEGEIRFYALPESLTIVRDGVESDVRDLTEAFASLTSVPAIVRLDGGVVRAVCENPLEIDEWQEASHVLA